MCSLYQDKLIMKRNAAKTQIEFLEILTWFLSFSLFQNFNIRGALSDFLRSPKEIILAIALDSLKVKLFHY